MNILDRVRQIRGIEYPEVERAQTFHDISVMSRVQKAIYEVRDREEWTWIECPMCFRDGSGREYGMERDIGLAEEWEMWMWVPVGHEL